MASFGRVTIGKHGKLAVTEETTFGTLAEKVFIPENKLDKVIRLMSDPDETQVFTADMFVREL